MALDPSAPRSGWLLVGYRCVQRTEPRAHCERCHKQIRHVHSIAHVDHARTYAVGVECATSLCGLTRRELVRDRDIEHVCNPCASSRALDAAVDEVCNNIGTRLLCDDDASTDTIALTQVIVRECLRRGGQVIVTDPHVTTISPFGTRHEYLVCGGVQ